MTPREQCPEKPPGAIAEILSDLQRAENSLARVEALAAQHDPAVDPLDPRVVEGTNLLLEHLNRTAQVTGFTLGGLIIEQQAQTEPAAENTQEKHRLSQQINPSTQEILAQRTIIRTPEELQALVAAHSIDYRYPPEINVGGHVINMRYLHESRLDFYGLLAALPNCALSVKAVVDVLKKDPYKWWGDLVESLSGGSHHALMKSYLHYAPDPHNKEQTIVFLQAPAEMPHHIMVSKAPSGMPEGIVTNPKIEAERQHYLAESIDIDGPVSLEGLSHRKRYFFSVLAQKAKASGPVFLPRDLTQIASAFVPRAKAQSNFVRKTIQEAIVPDANKPRALRDVMHPMKIGPNRSILVVAPLEFVPSYLQLEETPRKLSEVGLTYIERHEKILAIVRRYGGHRSIARRLWKYEEAGVGPLQFSQNSEQLFQQENKRYRILTKAEEQALFEEIEQGLLVAKIKATELENIRPGSYEEQALLRVASAYKVFFATNIRLAAWVAREKSSRNTPPSELYVASFEGLARAITRFNARKGFKFSTYAYNWIMQAILRKKAELSYAVRLPRSITNQISAMRRIEVHLNKVWGRQPTDTEIAEELGLQLHEVGSLRELASRRTVSLDTQVSSDDENDVTFHDVIAAESIAEESAPAPAEISADTLERLQKLQPIQKAVLSLTFGLPLDVPGYNDCFQTPPIEHSKAEIARLLNLSLGKVDEIRNDAIEALRSS